jgi:hypothetical protein
MQEAGNSATGPASSSEPAAPMLPAAPPPTAAAAATPPTLVRVQLASPFAAEGAGAGLDSSGAAAGDDVVTGKARAAWQALAQMASTVGDAQAAAAAAGQPCRAADGSEPLLTALETLEAVLGNAAQLPGEPK